MTPEQFTAFLKGEYDKWTPIIIKAKMGRNSMSARTSIYVEGFSHESDSGGLPDRQHALLGQHPGDRPGHRKVRRHDRRAGRTAPEMFAHVRRIVEAAGGSAENIIKMTVWMRDRSQREPVNREWLKMFPDPHSRPARHAIDAALDGEKLLECDFIAVLA